MNQQFYFDFNLFKGLIEFLHPFLLEFIHILKNSLIIFMCFGFNITANLIHLFLHFFYNILFELTNFHFGHLLIVLNGLNFIFINILDSFLNFSLQVILIDNYFSILWWNLHLFHHHIYILHPLTCFTQLQICIPNLSL